MAHNGKAKSGVSYNSDNPPSAYSNATVHGRLSQYTEMAREVHGPESDPSAHDLDGEIVMRVGGGKKHGRYWMGDCVIDTSSIPTLSQIRARSMSASPAIRPWPTTTSHPVNELQAQLQEERRRTMPASLVLPLPQAATPHQSGVASNQIGGSPASQIGASPAPQLELNPVQGSPAASNHGALDP